MLPHILNFSSLYTAFKNSAFYCNYLAPNLTCNKPNMNLYCFLISAVISVLISSLCMASPFSYLWF